MYLMSDDSVFKVQRIICNYSVIRLSHPGICVNRFGQHFSAGMKNVAYPTICEVRSLRLQNLQHHFHTDDNTLAEEFQMLQVDHGSLIVQVLIQHLMLFQG